MIDFLQLFLPFFKSYLKKPDPIHHESLRLVFRTSPVVSLYTEAHEAPLQLRCKKIGSAVLHNTEIQPIQTCLQLHLQPKHKQQFEQKEKNTSNHLAFRWSLFSKNPQFLLQMYLKASYHKYHLGSLKKNISNPPIKQTPKNKNISQHLSGKISHYPFIPS